jgi:hypothetical protein
MLKQLALRMGAVERVEVNVASFGSGEFHSTRVKVAADKPLPRVVTFSLKDSESMRLLVKYEKSQCFQLPWKDGAHAQEVRNWRI